MPVMFPQTQTDTPPSKFIVCALLLLATWVYIFGLGGQYVPSNGDEMVYVHIARATAQTGHWLPLASELENTRNTKPPMLFWQAMVAGNWGQNWTMAALRTPSLIYILLTAGAIAWVVRLVTRNTASAMLAACVYLAFLSTFRYGRPYLTSAPETFWLSLPLFGLLIAQLQTPRGSNILNVQAPTGTALWLWHTLCGLALGIGLAYKSFALIAPAAAAWWLALMLTAWPPSWRSAFGTSMRVAFSVLLALGVFGLWFVLDPDPQAVWREFVVAENAAKFSDSRGYWAEALSLSGSSLWSQLLSFAVNAGFLACVVIGAAVLGLPRLYRLWRQPEKPDYLLVLLAWVGVWLLVFMLPSQRSARYVIPAMPAIAILLGLYWQRIPRFWFVPTLLLCAGALVFLARISWVGYSLDLYSAMEVAAALICASAGIILVLLGLWRASQTRLCALACTLLVYATFNLTVAPMDGAIGSYPAGTIRPLEPGKDPMRIAAPNAFNSQFERNRFVLEGNHRFVPYETEARAIGRLAPGASLPTPEQALQNLLRDFDAVIWIQSSPSETQALCLPDCKVLGTRWQLKSRYLSGEINRDNLWNPQEWLFRREWLLTRTTAP
jgi:4-amino-4-deoxy-L-arabinose transferase-like glycosyltransferase